LIERKKEMEKILDEYGELVMVDGKVFEMFYKGFRVKKTGNRFFYRSIRAMRYLPVKKSLVEFRVKLSLA
jgi:hypothetical protein